MNQTMRWVGVCLVFFLSTPGMQAQQGPTPHDKLPGETKRPITAEPEMPRDPDAGAGQNVVVPRLVKFSSTAKDQLGHTPTDAVGVTFAIYREQDGGAPLWVETQNVEVDGQGYYTVLLGATKSEGLPVELFGAAEPRWLGVQLNLPGEVEQPRVLLVSVPYALKAADAESLGGRPASAYALVPATIGANTDAATEASPSTTSTGAQTTTTGKPKSTKNAVPAVITANFIPVFTDANGTLGNSLLSQSSTGVGVGQGPPSNQSISFDVNGGVRGTGLATGSRNVSPDAINTGALFLDGSNAMGIVGSNAQFTPGALFTKASFFSGGAERMTIDGATGNVGVGTTTPGQKLSVVGMIQSTSGGFVFPDSTVQATAAPASPNAFIRAITYLAGCDNCSVLTNADSQNAIFDDLIGAMTINSVTCFSDAGAPAINIQVNHGGSLSNVLSSNLTCSTSGAASTSFSTSALSANDILNFILIADGVAKRITMTIKTTVN